MPVFTAAESEYVEFVEVRSMVPAGGAMPAGGAGADAVAHTAQTTTRNEVDEDAWDSDGTWTHSTAVTASTARRGAAQPRDATASGRVRLLR
jgi:hypothetical protein